MARYKVYFLLKDRKPVYIGHTKNLRSRIPCHKDKEYDCVMWFDCRNKEEALAYEKRWQRKFRPIHNLNGVAAAKAINREPKLLKQNSKSVVFNVAVSHHEFDKIHEMAKKQERSPGNLHFILHNQRAT